MPKKKEAPKPAQDTTTPQDMAFISRLNREHLQKTEDIIRRMDAARDRLIIPEPENPMDIVDADGVPITDPDTGMMKLAPKGSPEYLAYIEEHREAIRLHEEWEQSPLTQEYVELRRELEAAQTEYSRRMMEYMESVTNAPSIATKAATQYVAPCDPVSQRIFSGQLSSVPEAIRISGAQQKKPVTTSVSVNFEALEGDAAIKGRKNLDRYTQTVYNGITSLWNAGNAYMTLGMIYEAMTGSDAKLPPKHAKKIEESIRTLMSGTVSINSQDEHNIRGYGGVKASYYRNLITADFVTVKVKGKRVDGAIRLFKTPVLYEYASAKRQVQTGDITLLNPPVNKTEETIVLIDYLRRRIDSMPSPRTGNKIRYAAVYDYLEISGTDATAKNKKYRIRGYITKTLDYWKERGFIQDYSEYGKDGKQYAEGVQIIPAGTKIIPQEGE